MATSQLVRWLQTKKFLLIELERLNHKTYYIHLILFVFTLWGGRGGVQFEQDFFIHSLKYNLSEIPIPYQIDLKEIAIIVKPPLMTTFFHSSGGPIIFLLISFHGVACQHARKSILQSQTCSIPPKWCHTSQSMTPPPYWPCLFNGHQSKFSILQIVGKFSN